jgi:hypothetical protein
MTDYLAVEQHPFRRHISKVGEATSIFSYVLQDNRPARILKILTRVQRALRVCPTLLIILSLSIRLSGAPRVLAAHHGQSPGRIRTNNIRRLLELYLIWPGVVLPG